MKCNHCGKRDVETTAGYCRKCSRKNSIVFSRTSDGYTCSLCVFAGNNCLISESDMHEHVRETHGFEWGDKEATLRAYEAIKAKRDRNQSQESLQEFA